MNRLAPIIIVLVLLVSCRPGRNDSSEYRFVDRNGWDYGDTLSFNPVLEDSVAVGCLTIALRHTNDYLYSNVWLEVTTTDSIKSRVDTIEMRLADDFGRWLGRGIGTDFQVSDTISPALRLHRPVTVGVRHIMRVDRLEDIEQVGISFTQ